MEVNVVVEHRNKEHRFTIDTDRYDPVMIVGLLQTKMNKIYEIVIEGDRVVVHKTSYIH